MFGNLDKVMPTISDKDIIAFEKELEKLSSDSKAVNSDPEALTFVDECKRLEDCLNHGNKVSANFLNTPCNI